MKGFHYVYILVSEANDEVHYSGVTRNLAARLASTTVGSAHIQRNADREKLKRHSRFDRKLRRVVFFKAFGAVAP